MSWFPQGYPGSIPGPGVLMNNILERLKKSRFRSSFKLNEEDIATIRKKGIETVQQHVKEILEKRIKFKKENDGRQTPYKGYFIFKAQHATATCCRGCIEKWYNIPRNKVLSDEEISYLAGIIMKWISSQIHQNL